MANERSIYNNRQGLSTREATLLSEWERRKKTTLRLDELRNLLGHPATAKAVVNGLLRKKMLRRLGPGIYAIRPFRTLGRQGSISAAAAAEVLLSTEPHYFGGLWAFSINHLTEQVYGSVLDAFVTRPHIARQLENARIAFHVIPDLHLDYGVTTVTIEDVAVRVSDPERTVLDALDYPSSVGGSAEAFRIVAPILPRLKTKTLVAYAARGSRNSTCQRLAILLERLGTPSAQLLPLRSRIAKTHAVTSLVPGAPRRGRLNKTWRVVENDRLQASA